MKSETTTRMKIESYTSKYLDKQNKFSTESERFFFIEYSGWIVLCFIYYNYLHIRLFYCFKPRHLNRQIYDTRCAKRAPNQIGQLNRSKLIQWILMSLLARIVSAAFISNGFRGKMKVLFFHHKIARWLAVNLMYDFIFLISSQINLLNFITKTKKKVSVFTGIVGFVFVFLADTARVSSF